MAAMDEARCTMKDHISREVEKIGKWPSNSPFPLTLYQLPNTFSAICKYMIQENQINIFLPPIDNTIDAQLLHNLHARVQEWGDLVRQGLVYATKSLTVLLNLEPINIPEGIKWEIFIVFPDRPCTVLCITENTHNPSHKKYLLQLTRNVISKLRKFTSEHVSVIYGLLGRDELISYDAFTKQMEDIEEETSQFCNPQSLMMNTEKCDNIIKAFLASIAATDLVAAMTHTACADTTLPWKVFDDKDMDDIIYDRKGFDKENDDKNSDEETLWFLTLKQFKIFVNNIDRDMVVLESVQKSGATLLLVEVGRRLNKIGSTVFTFWQKVCHILRRKNLGSFILTPSELRSQVHSPEVKYLVAEGVSVKDVQSLNNGTFLKIWLVNPNKTFEEENQNADISEDEISNDDEEGYESAVSDCDGIYHSSKEQSD